jgi:hypothetical protein
MEIRADSRLARSLDIRRAVLRNGGDIRATARELGMSHTNVMHHVKRADAASPLVYQSGDTEDREAMRDYMLACLDRAHIRRTHAD